MIRSLVKRCNRWLGDREFERRLARLSSRPWSFQWDLATSCNLSCIYCSRAMQFGAGQIMPRELVERVLKELVPYSSNLMLGATGEPLLHPNIKEVFSAVARVPFSFVSLVTNAMLLDEELTEMLVGIPINQIIISLDSVRAEVLPKIRRGLNFPATMDNILRLAKRRAQAPTGPRLMINCVLTRLNFAHLAEVARFAVDHGFHLLAVTTILGLISDPTAAPDDPLTLRADDLPLLREQLHEASEVMQSAGLGITFTTDREDIGVQLNLKEGNQLVGFPQARLRDSGVDWRHRTAFPSQQPTATCDAPWRSFVLHANGDISPCCFSIGKPLATMCGQSFRQAWNSRQFQLLRQSLATRGLHSLCYNKPCYFLPAGPKITAPDSLQPADLRGEIEFIADGAFSFVLALPSTLAHGRTHLNQTQNCQSPQRIFVRVRNTGDTIWRTCGLHPLGPGIVNIAQRLYPHGSRPPSFDLLERTPLHADVLPGDELEVELKLPSDLKPGTYVIEAALVNEMMFWFHERRAGEGSAKRELVIEGRERSTR